MFKKARQDHDQTRTEQRQTERAAESDTAVM